jgi:hypothetical protein
MNPWLILGLVLAFSGTFYAGYRKGDEHATTRAELKAMEQRAKDFAAAEKSRAEWDAKVTARDTSIKELKEAQVTAAEEYQTSLAKAQLASRTISRGVTASVRANPQDPVVCSLSDDTFSLLNQQINQTNSSTGNAAPIATSGLRSGIESCPFGDSGPANEILCGADGGFRFPAYAVR